jgi:hypothetical protein
VEPPIKMQALIVKAIMESPNEQATFSQIVEWIKSNFLFYKNHLGTNYTVFIFKCVPLIFKHSLFDLIRVFQKGAIGYILKKVACFNEVKVEKEDGATIWMCDYESYFKKASSSRIVE